MCIRDRRRTEGVHVVFKLPPGNSPVVFAVNTDAECILSLIHISQVQEFAEEVFSVVSGYELFESNGTIIEDICPLVHLCYWKKYAKDWFEKTRMIQFMANLVCYCLLYTSGCRTAPTFSSTTRWSIRSL